MVNRLFNSFKPQDKTYMNNFVPVRFNQLLLLKRAFIKVVIWEQLGHARAPEWALAVF